MEVFFLHYDSRSGSTFLAQKMTEVFDIISPPEVNFIPRLCRAYSSGRASAYSEIIKADPKHKDWAIPDGVFADIQSRKYETFVELLEDLLVSFLQSNRSKSILIKKNYIRYIDDINGAIPTAKHIFLIRDGRAIFSSKKKSIKSTTGKPFTKSVFKAAFQWRRFVAQALLLNENLSDRGTLCFYEKIISEGDAISQLASWMGVVRATGKGKYILPERYSYGLHENIYKSADVSRLEQWKTDLELNEVRLYDYICGETLERLGYLPVDPQLTFHYAVKDVLRWFYELLRYRAWA